MSKLKKILIAFLVVLLVAVPAASVFTSCETVYLPDAYSPPIVAPDSDIPASGDTSSGDSEDDTNSGEDNTNNPSTEPTFTYSRTFGENSPAVIAQVSNIISSENLSVEVIYDTYGWSIGDEIEITMKDGQVVDHRIIGFNHDTITGTTSKAGICLQTVNCFNTLAQMNTSDTNAGGWESSLMRTETAVSTLANYPDEWQDQIKAVDKKSANGGGSSYTATVITSDKLFVLSAVEMGCLANNVKDGASEGLEYSWYTTNHVTLDMIKYYDSNSDGVINNGDFAVNWWLRSCSSYYSDCFWTHSADTISTIESMNSSHFYGFSPAFNI